MILPKTKVTAEAKMVGALFAKGQFDGVVYTVEQGFEGSMLGGWDKGTHLNFGGSTVKNAKEFKELIVKNSD